jgi:hypothetical protein
MTSEEPLRKFMTKMDTLWKKYDQAVDKIPRGDDHAYKRYAEHLDNFFVCYWRVFNDAVDGAAVDDIVRLADLQYEESLRVLEQTWHNTTDALLRRATELKDEKARARALPQLLVIFQNAERQLKGIRKGDTMDGRIAKHMGTADLFEEFIGKLEGAN